MGEMDAVLNVAVTQEKIMIDATKELVKFIAALSIRAWLYGQQQKELTGGERVMWKMIKSNGGTKLQACTMSQEDVNKIVSNAKKYNFQFAVIDENPILKASPQAAKSLIHKINAAVTKIEDKHNVNNDEKKQNIKTVFIRESDWSQFEQFCKDFNITATKHGTISGHVEKPQTVDNVIDDFKKNEDRYSKDKVFDAKIWIDDYISRGGDMDNGLLEDALNKLEAYLIDNGYQLNHTGLPINDKGIDEVFSKEPAQVLKEESVKVEKEEMITQQKSTHSKVKEPSSKEKNKKNSLDADRDAPDEYENVKTAFSEVNIDHQIKDFKTNQEALDWGGSESMPKRPDNDYSGIIASMKNESTDDVGFVDDKELQDAANLQSVINQIGDKHFEAPSYNDREL